jgi:phosphoglycolate phosphatase-like HAD superfamily hydrolase
MDARRVTSGSGPESLAGIIFDVDGTLTEPGAIDFGAMYKRIGLKPMKTMDLIFQVEAMTDEERKREAHQIIIDEEMKGVDRMKLRPDIGPLLRALQRSKINVAISTRNCDAACQKFLEASEIVINVDQMSPSPNVFSPVITRDSLNGINKPDPRVSYHIFKEWGFLSTAAIMTSENGDKSVEEVSIEYSNHVKSRIDKFGVVWFVGDSADDLKCGRAAGCKTCLILTDSNDKILVETPELVDLAVNSLSEFANAIGICM